MTRTINVLWIPDMGVGDPQVATDYRLRNAGQQNYCFFFCMYSLSMISNFLVLQNNYKFHLLSVCLDRFIYIKFLHFNFDFNIKTITKPIRYTRKVKLVMILKHKKKLKT